MNGSPNMDCVCLRVSLRDGAPLEHLNSRDIAFGPIADRYSPDGVGPSLYLNDPEGNSVALKG